MKHRCDEFWLQGVRCPGRHAWEDDDCDPDDEDCEDEEGQPALPPPGEIPFFLMLPERTGEVTQLIGLDALAAEAFVMEWGASVPWGDRFPKAAIDYTPAEGYFLPNPYGDRHVAYPNQPAYVQPGPDQTVLVRGTYYTGDKGYAAEMFALAAAAILGLSGAYIVAQGGFQNLTSYMMGRYLNAPVSTSPAGQGYFFQAETWQNQPGDVFDKYVATVEVGEQPATWY